MKETKKHHPKNKRIKVVNIIYLSGFKKYDSNIVGIDSKLYLENLFLKLKNMMGILIDCSNIV
jgi:hypothetical protein